MFLCLCLRTEVESVKRKSERGPTLCREGGLWVQANCSGGRWVYKGKACIGFTMKRPGGELCA